MFGAGGSIGSAVAKKFAAEGTEVFLAGRTKSNLEEVTNHITKDGGHAHPTVIDALDYAAVDEYIDSIARQTRSKCDDGFNRCYPPT